MTSAPLKYYLCKLGDARRPSLKNILKMRQEKEFKISFWAAQATTIVSVTLVLLLVSIIAVITVAANRETHRIKESVELSAILKDDVTDGAAKATLDTLSKFPFVKDIRLITKKQAMEQWKQQTGEDLEAVFGINPLSPEIEFSLSAAYSTKDSLRAIEERVGRLADVESVALPEVDMVESMNHNIDALSIILGVVACVMLIISFVLINNMVRLTIYSRRFTIHTMQLVGATKGFISKPAILRNLYAGFIAGLITSGLMAISIVAAPAGLGSDLSSYISWTDYAIISAAVTAGGALICAVAASVATGRYLNKDYGELFK